MKRRDFITRKKMKALRGNFACAALLAFVLPAQADPKWLLPDGIKSVEVNGYEMAYQEMGSGVPLVLVHGAMNDYRSWSQLVPVWWRNSVNQLNLRLTWEDKYWRLGEARFQAASLWKKSWSMSRMFLPIRSSKRSAPPSWVG